MRRILFLSILLVPAFSAAAMQAGFPSQAIWASVSSTVEGETIVVSAIVLNGGSAALRGTLVFTANDTRIGAREFELPRGESQIHSIEWKPKKGEYKLAAKIEGTSAKLSQRETPSIVVTVTEPPLPPSAIQQMISQVVQKTVTIASSSSPIVVQAAQAVFARAEALRKAGIKRLENYLASQSSSRYLGSDLSIGMGDIAGTSTSIPASNVAGFGASGEKGKGALSKLAQTAAAAALFGMKNAWLFYPFLALATLGLLYFLARRVRRQRD